MGWQDYIHSDPEVLIGKPVVKGTRLSVEFLLGLLAAGWTQAQILDNYPSLTSEALRAIEPHPHPPAAGGRASRFVIPRA